MSTVTITRAGNLLEIKPAPAFLAGALTYSHRLERRPADRFAGMGDKSVVIEDRPVFRWGEGGAAMYTLGGLRHRVERLLSDKGYEVSYVDTWDRAVAAGHAESVRQSDAVTADPDNLFRCMPGIDFRVKQDVILATIMASDYGQIIAPTAYGKTFIMLAIVALYPRANIIMASPSITLLESTYTRIKAITMQVGRVGNGKNYPDRITLCTVQSILRAPVHKCDILLIDECHCAAAPKMSNDLAMVRSPRKVFGLTATPTGRGDNAELVIEALVGPKVIEVDYAEAASEGIVAAIKVHMVDIGSDACSIDTSAWKSRVAKKRNAYWRNSTRNSRIAEAVMSVPESVGIDNPQVLVLVETTEHAFRLKKLLPGFTVVHGDINKDKLQDFASAGILPPDFVQLRSRDRGRMLTEFESGTLRKVIATGTWGTGIDCRHLDVLVNASGACSTISVTQWAGRNSRVYAGKRFGLVIDCLDKWDDWASRRSRERYRLYKSKGWEFLNYTGRRKI